MLSVTWNPGRHIELSILSLQRHSDSCERAASKNGDLDLRLDAEMQRAVRLCVLQMAVAWRGMASSRLDSPAHRVTRCSPRARCSSSPPAPIPACLESTRLALPRLAWVAMHPPAHCIGAPFCAAALSLVAVRKNLFLWTLFFELPLPHSAVVPLRSLTLSFLVCPK